MHSACQLLTIQKHLNKSIFPRLIKKAVKNVSSLHLNFNSQFQNRKLQATSFKFTTYSTHQLPAVQEYPNKLIFPKPINNVFKNTNFKHQASKLLSHINIFTRYFNKFSISSFTHTSTRHLSFKSTTHSVCLLASNTTLDSIVNLSRLEAILTLQLFWDNVKLALIVLIVDLS